MPKLTLDDVGNINQSLISTINANNQRIEDAVENSLSRDGTTPNTMTADLDMDENDILNVNNLGVNLLDAVDVKVGGRSFLDLQAQIEADADTATAAAASASTSATRAEAAAQLAATQAKVPIFTSIAVAQVIDIDESINVIQVYGRGSASDGQGGFFTTVNTGERDTFSDGGGRTWYRIISQSDTVHSSVYPATSAGLYLAEELAARAAWSGVRVDNGYTLTLDRPTSMVSSVNPRVPLIVSPRGRLIRDGAANMTFFNTFEAGRHEVFRNWPAINLSFLRGQHFYPEWFDTPANVAANLTPALQTAFNLVNYSEVILGNKNYLLNSNVNVTRNYTSLIGAGEVKTNLQAPDGASTGIQLNPAGNDASRLSRLRVSDFTMTRTSSGGGTGGVGIASYWNQASTLDRIQIDDFLIGLYFLRSPNMHVHEVKTNFEGTTGGSVGFHIDGNGGGAGALGNASARFTDCAASLGVGANKTGTIGWKLTGEYLGDLVFRHCDTQRFAIACSNNLTNTLPDTNGNADITFDHCFWDGWTTAGYYQIGNTDNLVEVTMIGGWINPVGPAAAGGTGILLVNTTGFAAYGVQFGVGGRFVTTGSPVFLDNTKNCIIVDCLIKDWGRSVDLENSSGNKIEPQITGGGNISGGIRGITLTGSSNNNTIKPKFGRGAVVRYGVNIGSSCSDNEVEIGPTDFTNWTDAGVGNLVQNSGTRTRIKIAGPATLITDTGSDTYLWCEPTVYTPTYSVATTTNRVSWYQEGKTVHVEATVTLNAASGAPYTISLPKPAEGLARGSGRNASNGADLVCYTGGSGSTTMNVLTDANGAPAASGEQIFVTLSYEAL